MRFTSVAVPRGATITHATAVRGGRDAERAHGSAIQGQAADNAAVFGCGRRQISTRARTVASVAWSPPTWGLVSKAGPNQRTPELATVVQEIVNRTGWASGNALALIITGSGHRTARAYEGKPTATPLLHIEYDNGPPQPPTNVSAPTISRIARAGQALHVDPGTWNRHAPVSYAYQWLRCDATGAGCGDIRCRRQRLYTRGLRCRSDDPGTVSGSNSVGSSAATSAQTAPVDVASLSDPVIAAAGDLCSSSIGDCAGTADLLDQINPTAVLTLGDNAYEDGSLAQYNAEYKPYLGQARQQGVPGSGRTRVPDPQRTGLPRLLRRTRAGALVLVQPRELAHRLAGR